MRTVLVLVALTALASAVALIAPDLDLWASGLFYRAGEGFYLADHPLARLVYAAIPVIAWTVGGASLVGLLVSLWRLAPLFANDRRIFAYLLLALALGPGLVVNTVFKDHWGRARPSQIVEFGGTQHFTPAPLPAAECRRNCSFVAGHAAMGFYLVALAFLVGEGRRRTVAIAAALAFGALVGLVRIIQGGHFLSDVVFAGLAVFAVTRLLFEAVIVRPAIADRTALAIGAGLAGAARAVAAGLATPGRRFVFWTLATIISAALAMAFLDRPLARYFHDRDGDLRALFMVIVQFGVSTGYLVGCAVLFVGLHIAARQPGLAELAPRLRAWARLPLFVFSAVAIAGLTTNLLKILFGRARPKLLFLDPAQYGFDWLRFQADWWSFPSGHATAIVALMAALYWIWPRHLMAYVLIGALVGSSRIVVAAHYLSDVIFATYLAILITAYVKGVFARSGIDLKDARAGLPSPASTLGWAARLGLRS